MLVFEKTGKINTEATLSLALDKAQELSCPIVVASSKGYTVQSLLKMIEDKNLKQKVFLVAYVAGFRGKGIIDLPEDISAELENKGIKIIRAAHALSAGERALSTKHGGIYPLEIAAQTLRFFGQGTKVCVEISIMAMDTGLLNYGEPIVAIAGTGTGADTALVLSPSYTASMFDTKIHEILCKPHT